MLNNGKQSKHYEGEAACVGCCPASALVFPRPGISRTEREPAFPMVLWLSASDTILKDAISLSILRKLELSRGTLSCWRTSETAFESLRRGTFHRFTLFFRDPRRGFLCGVVLLVLVGRLFVVRGSLLIFISGYGNRLCTTVWQTLAATAVTESAAIVSSEVPLALQRCGKSLSRPQLFFILCLDFFLGQFQARLFDRHCCNEHGNSSKKILAYCLKYAIE